MAATHQTNSGRCLDPFALPDSAPAAAKMGEHLLARISTSPTPENLGLSGMKLTKPNHVVLTFALLALLPGGTVAAPSGTAFTYQGRLNDGGGPANGSYDLRFKLFVDPLGDTQTGNAVVTNGVSVASGLFMVTVDFGEGVFNGSNYWLEVDVKTNGAGAYVNLSPLQAVTPVPYAVFAEKAGNGGFAAGTYTNAVTLSNAANNFSGSFAGNGAGLTGVNASTLGGLGAAGFWQLGGNAGITPGVNFVGTTDNRPLEIRVNNQRAVRIEYTTDTPNIIGGWSNNFAAPGVVMATIGGGGGVSVSNGSLNTNSVWSSYGTVSGGLGNQAGSINDDPSSVRGATVGGGANNTAGAHYSAISGGTQNTIVLSSTGSAIGGGGNNTIQTNAYQSTISGGAANTIQTNAYSSTICGGFTNTIQVSAHDSTINGGHYNTIQSNAYQSTISGGTGNTIWPDAYSSTIGGGYLNTIQTNAHNATIGGGELNTIQANAFFSIVGGGLSNTIQATATYSTISGGRYNAIQTNAYLSVVGGGYNNNILTNAHYAAIPGGINNVAAGSSSFAFGNGAKALQDGTFVWGDSTPAYISSSVSNSWTARASGGVRFFSNSGATVGVQLAAGGNAWSPMSDRNVKENFQPVDQRAVLDKVCHLPVTEWNLISQPTGIRHIGPMAQDFQAAFGVGEDDRHISTSDADGVALAAIQGLNQKVEQVVKEKDARIQILERDVAALKAMVNSLIQESSGGEQ